MTFPSLCDLMLRVQRQGKWADKCVGKVPILDITHAKYPQLHNFIHQVKYGTLIDSHDFAHVDQDKCVDLMITTHAVSVKFTSIIDWKQFASVNHWVHGMSPNSIPRQMKWFMMNPDRVSRRLYTHVRVM